MGFRFAINAARCGGVRLLFVYIIPCNQQTLMPSLPRNTETPLAEGRPSRGDETETECEPTVSRWLNHCVGSFYLRSSLPSIDTPFHLPTAPGMIAH
ncbi:hypothetical protein MUK42_37017 [Musa troglodytarum]|uniref:Uncharacterized protein n=1 Tax=Musa troglodytarum TaxID=320322 RepID=A0A9E7F8N8_9LILI|nr:hypothetical protein MUK42_37017 [Musa troglodytarum]